MTLRKKRKVLRWSVRILMLIVLLPIATMITVRYAGWLTMRKSDREIRAFLGPRGVNALIDTFQLRSREIVYLRTSLDEPKDGALILVHGSPGSMDAFLDYMVDTSLLHRADIVTYDRPGYGHSGFGLSEPSLSRQADILCALMDSLGYVHYWLAGHSYGAPVAVQAAVRRPSKVKGIGLIAGSVSASLEPESAAWRKWIDLPGLRDILPVTMRVSNEELMPLRGHLRLLENDWRHLTVPVTLVHGTKDVLVPFENVTFAQQQLIRADTVMIKAFEGESHFVLWTHQRQIVEELVRLLER